jgi:hypothetical protein
MTQEIALRLAYIFKRDFKKARFQAACLNTYPNFQQFKNPSSERRFDRKVIMFDVTKALYLECRETLKLNYNDALPKLSQTKNPHYETPI